MNKLFFDERAMKPTAFLIRQNYQWGVELPKDACGCTGGDVLAALTLQTTGVTSGPNHRMGSLR